jgi:diadenosine tetraphosphate (Ap4A) HIT family hydrolase
LEKIANAIKKAIKKAMKTDFVVSFIIGEEIPHAHIHLVPRFPEDGHGALIDLSLIRKIDKDEMEKVAKEIRDKI